MLAWPCLQICGGEQRFGFVRGIGGGKSEEGPAKVVQLAERGSTFFGTFLGNGRNTVSRLGEFAFTHTQIIG